MCNCKHLTGYEGSVFAAATDRNPLSYTANVLPSTGVGSAAKCIASSELMSVSSFAAPAPSSDGFGVLQCWYFQKCKFEFNFICIWLPAVATRPLVILPVYISKTGVLRKTSH